MLYLTCHDLILEGGESIKAVGGSENPLVGDDRAAAEVGDARQEVPQRDLGEGGAGAK